MPASQVGQHPRTLGQHQQNLHQVPKENVVAVSVEAEG